MLQLGILELGESLPGVSDAEILESTIEYARLAEAGEYSRFWLGEHHEPGVAWRSPEMMLPILAGYTDHIRIGAGGMLLPLHSPLRIAQNFKLLSTLFPNRIDLGIGRGFTSEHIAGLLLNGLSMSEVLPQHDQRAESVFQYLQNESFTNKNEHIVTAPVSHDLPEVWMLGTSGSSTSFIAKKKCSFSFSIMHNSPHPLSEKLTTFQTVQNFYEEVNEEPLRCNVAIGIVAGENQTTINRIIAGHKKNVLINISGTPPECAEQIQQLAEKFRVEEVLLNIISDSIENKKFCIEALSKEVLATV
jgi:luciferase family oxidoreductase group 1